MCTNEGGTVGNHGLGGAALQCTLPVLVRCATFDARPTSFLAVAAAVKRRRHQAIAALHTAPEPLYPPVERL